VSSHSIAQSDPDRKAAILEIVTAEGSVDTVTIRHKLATTQSTVLRLLNELCDEGVIQRDAPNGVDRNVRYKLADQTLDP
jgi:predicted transcriptional regulator